MRLLIDQNVPDAVARCLRQRGHEVMLVRELLGRSSPDQLIAITADFEGIIVVTMDKDFTRFRTLIPEGSLGRFKAGSGAIRIATDEAIAAARLENQMDIIEFYFDRATRQGKRMHIRVTTTTIQLGDSGD